MVDFGDPDEMTRSDIRILGVPMGIGGGKPGTAMGPWKVREKAFVERLCRTVGHFTIEDAGDVVTKLNENLSRLERTACWWFIAGLLVELVASSCNFDQFSAQL